MSQVAITLAILVGALILFVTELVPLGITPLIVLSSLAVSGVLPVKDVLTGFSNDTTIMVLFMFPVGEALFRTGVCDYIGRRVIKLAGKNEVRLIALVMLAAAVLSAFTSNTGTTIVMAPLVVSVAREAGVSAGALLLPLAFGGVLWRHADPGRNASQCHSAGVLRQATGESLGFSISERYRCPSWWRPSCT